MMLAGARSLTPASAPRPPPLKVVLRWEGDEPAEPDRASAASRRPPCPGGGAAAPGCRVPSTSRPAAPALRRDVLDGRALLARAQATGEPVALCRCFRSSEFPYCDGVGHHRHNRESGDNVGPVVLRVRPKPRM